MCEFARMRTLAVMLYKDAVASINRSAFSEFERVGLIAIEAAKFTDTIDAINRNAAKVSTPIILPAYTGGVILDARHI